MEGAIFEEGAHLIVTGVPTPTVPLWSTAAHALEVAVSFVTEEPPVGEIPPPVAAHPEDFVENVIVSDDLPPAVVRAGLNLIVPVMLRQVTDPGWAAAFAQDGVAVSVNRPTGRKNVAAKMTSLLERLIVSPLPASFTPRAGSVRKGFHILGVDARS